MENDRCRQPKCTRECQPGQVCADMAQRASDYYHCLAAESIMVRKAMTDLKAGKPVEEVEVSLNGIWQRMRRTM